MDQIDTLKSVQETLSSATETMQKLGEENQQLLVMGNHYMDQVASSCKQVSKKASKIKKTGKILTEASTSTDPGLTSKSAQAFMKVK